MPVEVQVARQAIYDRTNKAIAYELLFRALADSACSTRNDDLASWQVLSTGFLDIGLDALLKGRRALVNVPRAMLLDDRIRSLPADVIGLEILEDVEPDAEVLEAIRALRASGYLMVLDDYIGLPESEPLLDVVEWVKVDLRAIGVSRAAALAKELAPRGLRLLAEKVETQEERDAAMAAGYDYFQGYFLHRPRLVGGRTLATSLEAELKLLHLLASGDFNLQAVRTVVEGDVALCYRLIRYTNSVRFGGRHEITSIRQCLMRLGEDETRRWIALVLLPTLSAGRSPEIADAALTRARMCELITRQADTQIPPSVAFTAGLFTLMDAVLDMPMPDVVHELGLNGALSDALLHQGESSLGTLLEIVEAYERAPVEEIVPQCTDLQIPLETVGDAYLMAVQWTAEVSGVKVPTG